MYETERFCFSFLMGVEKNLPDGQLEGMLICSRKMPHLSQSCNWGYSSVEFAGIHCHPPGSVLLL